VTGVATCLSRLRTSIAGVQATEGGAGVAPTAARLRELLQERARIYELRASEEARAEQLGATAAAKDKERLDAITNAKLAEAEIDRAHVDGLLRQANECRRLSAEAAAVVGRIDERAAALGLDIEALQLSYRNELAGFLDALYGGLMQRYTELVPELAETVLQLAAVRRVMLSEHLGDTNGWSGEIFLPQMRQGEGKTLEPMLDGASHGFAVLADARVREVHRMMREAGFALF